MAAAAFKGAIAAALGLGGCTSINATGSTFEGSQWQVVAIAGQPVPRTGNYRLSFDQGKIGGRFGCNSFSGTYRVERDTLVTGMLATTLMGCPEPAATHETMGMAVLAQPMRLDWTSGNRLSLRNERGSVELERAR